MSNLIRPGGMVKPQKEKCLNVSPEGSLKIYTMNPLFLKQEQSSLPLPYGGMCLLLALLLDNPSLKTEDLFM